MKTLSALKTGERAVVKELLSEGSLRRRFLDMGLSSGTEIYCSGKSPLGDPSAYIVRGTKIAVRRRDAEQIILH